MIDDVERLALIQSGVVKLRRLAAGQFDREISLRLSALADTIEHERERRIGWRALLVMGAVLIRTLTETN